MPADFSCLTVSCDLAFYSHQYVCGGWGEQSWLACTQPADGHQRGRMMEKKRFRVFVDKSVQGALARRVTLYWAVCLWGTFCVLAGFPIVVTLLSGIPNSPTVGQLLHKTWLGFWPTLVASAFVLPVVIWDVLRLSHRFAGPMVRLRHSLRDLADGKDVPTVTFREGDFWTEFAEHFNRLSDRLKSENKATAEELEETIDA